MRNYHPNERARVVMVTGASAGVGRATAIAFARRGARVGLIARGRAGLAGAKQDVEAAGGQAFAFAADVTDAEAVDRAAAELESACGGIDVWVNNAMVSVFSPVKEMTPDFGAHGRFDSLAHVRSWEQLAAQHRTMTIGMLLTLAAGVAAWASIGSRRLPKAA